MAVPITSGTGEAGEPVVLSLRGRLPLVGDFFLVGAGLEHHSGELSPGSWLQPLGDLDGDGSIEHRLEVPGSGPGGWGDPAAVGCPATTATPYPPLALILRQDREDLDGDGRWDVFEDRNRNRTLDPGEDRDGDGRLTPWFSTGIVAGGDCEGVTREDVDCDGFIDVINEDFNNNGRWDPGEFSNNDQNWDNIDEDRNKDGVFDPRPVSEGGEDTNLNGLWDGRDGYIEDRNGNGLLDDRPVVLPDDQIFRRLPDGTLVPESPLYPYGALVPSPGFILAASVAWNGAAYDFDAIDVPLRTITSGDGRRFRVIDPLPIERLIPRVSAVREEETPRFAYRLSVEPPRLDGIDDVGGRRRIIAVYEALLPPSGVGDYGEVFLDAGGPTGSLVAPVPAEGRFLSIVSYAVPGQFPLVKPLHLLPLGAPRGAFFDSGTGLPETLRNVLDADGDSLPLPFDTCPDHSATPQGFHPDQNQDGIGDVCDPAFEETSEVAAAWDVRPDEPGDPGVREGAAMAYDAARRVVVLFGGAADTLTWVYDGADWSSIQTSPAPAARSGHGMVYAPDGGRVLLYGGATPGGTPLNDLWEYAGGTWRRIETPVAPPAVDPSAVVTAYHEALGFLVALFESGETWVFDGASWRLVPTSRTPTPRRLSQMAYDARRQVVVLSGGIAEPRSPGGVFRRLNDTWEFDGTTWQPADTRGDLAPFFLGAMTYDAARGRMVAFGGRSAYAHRPAPQSGPPVILDGATAATRLYEGTRWTYLPSRPTVPPQIDPAIAYDAARDRLVVHGDRDAFGNMRGMTAMLRLPEDTDGDGVPDRLDGCPLVPDPGQNDADRDGAGDACDSCPAVPNPTQRNLDGDGEGDACDSDRDGDGVPNAEDACPAAYVAGRPLSGILGGGGPDTDLDGIADDCDVCPEDPGNDADGDGRCGDADNCPTTANVLQEDANGDGSGDACQPILVLGDVRQDGGEVLEVTARASDPDGDPLAGSIAFTAIEEFVLRAVHPETPETLCGSDVYPAGHPGEGIVYGTGPAGERFLADLDGVVGCVDGVPDFLIAPRPCAASAGPGFDFVVNLPPPPQAICVGRYAPSAPDRVDPGSLVDLTVLVADAQSARLVSIGAAPALELPFIGRWPAVSDLEGLSAGARYRFQITVTDGSSLPVTAETTLLYQGERRLVIHAGIARALIRGGGEVECDRPGGGVVTLDGSGSGTPEPGLEELSFEWFEDLGGPSERRLGTGETLTAILGLGVHEIALRVTTLAGVTDTARVVVAVRDTAPPMLTSAPDPAGLWPPNHLLIPVVFSVEAHDVCDPAPVTTLAAVASSEPDDAPGDGDGRTTGDIADAQVGAPDTRILLRAERSAPGPGRTYDVVYRSADASGNTAITAAHVRVPLEPASESDPGRP